MPRTAIWAYGFDKAQAKVEEEVETLGNLPFDTIILPFIHAEVASGSIRLKYNDTPIEKLWSGLPKELRRLKEGFPVRKRLLFSVAPQQSNWDAIATNVSDFTNKFVKLTDIFAVDGMDLDYEGSYQARDKQLLGKMVAAYRTIRPEGLVTAAPYTAEDFWTGKGGVLELSRSKSGQSQFSWFNVQFYAGAGNLPPGSYVETLENWATAAGRTGNGVADPVDFIVPGCNGTAEARRNFSPDEFETGLADIRGTKGSVGGGFVWNYEGLEWTPKEWCEAIRKGCG
jgi:hypothetical protein